jgi:hypothetical protein
MADVHVHVDGLELDTGVDMVHPGFDVRREEQNEPRW